MTGANFIGTGWLAHATAASLRAAARLNLAGLVLALVNTGLAGIMAPAGKVWLVIGIVGALAGAVQLWLLVRIEIDRRLFDVLSTASTSDELAALDTALISLGWMPHERAGRAMPERARGAGRFLVIAGALVALQWLVAVVILFLR
ncbi:hypothetical protein [Cupriavidus pauculus]|uniref:Uncharacterized protein n=1 Tax=Cupriavidus pauculus TaxID=82633 RepID=A0A2N5CDX2_9BURK|nr:hypothetical protein [Cupriavidus pauculus]PLQ00372.1 hypothetical protein CYJ10_12115 [Cupriavidus pauculus]